MEILPIKSIRDEDGPLIGSSLLNLGKLYHFGLPVAEGVVVLPPEIHLKKVLEHFHLKDQEVFEQSLILFRSEVRKIEIPSELKEVLSKRKLDAKKIWHNLLASWISEIRSRIFREGFSSNTTLHLSAQPVFFTGKISVSGEAHFDEILGHSEFKLHHGNLTHEQIDLLDQVIIKANKKLFLPQKYYFVVDTGLKIVKVSPFTQHISPDKVEIYNPKHELPKKVQAQIAIPKSSVKVFLDLSEGFIASQNIDGVIIAGEKIADTEMRKAKLAEAASEYNHLPVIYKLPDIKNAAGDLRGALRLIHDQVLLKSEAELLLTVRNKKRLFNASIAIPLVRSVGELLQIKRDLASYGISRKGMLKMWVELAVPENILSMEEYILAGFDGAIINLDEIATYILGLNANSKETSFSEKQVAAILKFLEDGVRMLRRAGIPIVFTGSLSLHDESMKFLFDKGIYGIVADQTTTNHIHEQLKFMEFHHIKHKTIN